MCLNLKTLRADRVADRVIVKLKVMRGDLDHVCVLRCVLPQMLVCE